MGRAPAASAEVPAGAGASTEATSRIASTLRTIPKKSTQAPAAPSAVGGKAASARQGSSSSANARASGRRVKSTRETIPPLLGGLDRREHGVQRGLGGLDIRLRTDRLEEPVTSLSFDHRAPEPVPGHR